MSSIQLFWFMVDEKVRGDYIPPAPGRDRFNLTGGSLLHIQGFFSISTYKNIFLHPTVNNACSLDQNTQVSQWRQYKTTSRIFGHALIEKTPGMYTQN